MKSAQEDDRHMILELRTENEKQMQDLKEQRQKLEVAEKSFKDMEILRGVSDDKVEE